MNKLSYLFKKGSELIIIIDRVLDKNIDMFCFNGMSFHNVIIKLADAKSSDLIMYEIVMKFGAIKKTIAYMPIVLDRDYEFREDAKNMFFDSTMKSVYELYVKSAEPRIKDNARNAGRKSSYSASSCEAMYDWLKQGFSYEDIGKEWGMSPSTVCRHLKRYMKENSIIDHGLKLHI